MHVLDLLWLLIDSVIKYFSMAEKEIKKNCIFFRYYVLFEVTQILFTVVMFYISIIRTVHFKWKIVCSFSLCTRTRYFFSSWDCKNLWVLLVIKVIIFITLMWRYEVDFESFIDDRPHEFPNLLELFLSLLLKNSILGCNEWS